VAVTDCNTSHLCHCVQDSSTGAGAGYEQDVQQFKNGDLKKGAKDNIKKVGSTINKKANQGGTKVGVHHCLQNVCMNSLLEFLEARSLRRPFAAVCTKHHEITTVQLLAACHAQLYLCDCRRRQVPANLEVCGVFLAASRKYLPGKVAFLRA